LFSGLLGIKQILELSCIDVNKQGMGKSHLVTDNKTPVILGEINLSISIRKS
jgi:hypothetical protein